MALLFLSLCFALARWHRSAGVVGLPKQNDHVASASHVDRAAAMAGVRNATLNESKPRVAVCVTGMLERLQPRSLVENLFLPNRDVAELHSFWVLQGRRKAFYSTEGHAGGGVSPWAELDASELQDELAFSGLTNVHVAYMPARSRADWKELTASNLTAIIETTHIQEHVLEMYRHHVACAQLIADQEEHLGAHFDYIISTREDVFIFHPLKLEVLIETLLQKGCDMLAKNCLNWNGINMRMQLFRRKAGMVMLGQRLEYFQYLQDQGTKVSNPEGFEEKERSHHRLRLCTVGVNTLPVAVVRVNTKKDRYKKWIPERGPARKRLIDQEFAQCFLFVEVPTDCLPGENTTQTRAGLTIC